MDNTKPPGLEPDNKAEDELKNSGNLSPEEIASNAFKKDAEPPDLNSMISTTGMPAKKRNVFSFRNLTKKQKIIIAIAVAIVLAGGSFAAWWFVLRPKPPQPTIIIEVEEEPEPAVIPSKLTGLPVPREYNDRVVIGVTIENSPNARPQSGLKEAGVVYEAVAEGGITRFLAVYQDTEPDYVGPVRSARAYFLRWVLPYEAGYAHVGGSPEALAEIPVLGVRDLDQFSSSGAFQRVATRYAPHNVYTGIPQLRTAAHEKGWLTSEFEGFLRTEDENPSSPEDITAGNVNLAISSALYNVAYTYDPATNSYLRHQGGTPHMDERAATQITPKVVIAIVTDKGFAPNGVHSTYRTTGSGTMFVFQNGTVEQGTWEKANDTAQFTFTNQEGDPLRLIPGQTWISFMGAVDQITYNP